MDPETQKMDALIAERISILPEEITEIFTLGILDDTLAKLGSSSNLSLVQKRILETEVSLVLLLFLPKTGFTERITEALEISHAEAESIASLIEEEIFFLVDDILEEVDASFNGNKMTSPRTPPTTETQTPTAPAQPSISSTPLTTSTPEQPIAPQTPITQAVAEQNVAEKTAETVVKPLRTMAADVDSIHGYGAYRKMFPDQDDEGVVHATSQEDVLKKKNS